jgi:hypothetical protein
VTDVRAADARDNATLARDGRATLAWIERYLERLRDLPVLAQVEPGEIRSRILPTRASRSRISCAISTTCCYRA